MWQHIYWFCMKLELQWENGLRIYLEMFWKLRSRSMYSLQLLFFIAAAACAPAWASRPPWDFRGAKSSSSEQDTTASEFWTDLLMFWFFFLERTVLFFWQVTVCFFTAEHSGSFDMLFWTRSWNKFRWRNHFDCSNCHL